ncbi:MAG: branched-chain amino acid ABC transporter permease [Pseudomonadales bacterium]|nr:branched-chain amino acid ABC transporter permease [Pseudomonadales bacterium]NRA15675.1 branched-chain amino acid ABC transporter permease [Oceanospirillaceae bacterium]
MNILTNSTLRPYLAFTIMAALLVFVGTTQSWGVALTLINMCIISAIMALGVNIQWGYAGLFNVGIMGFCALGGAAAVLVSKAPVTEAWSAGGAGMGLALLSLVGGCSFVFILNKLWGKRPLRKTATFLAALAVYFLARHFYDPASAAIEAVDPAKTGYLGGMGLPIVFSWLVGGLFAAGAAWLIGKVTLGLRTDYLAIATLGIAEIIVALLKNEDWLTRGAKNVTGLPRPVPFEIDLQQTGWFIDLVQNLNSGALANLATDERAAALKSLVMDASGIFVKLCYAGLFLTVLVILFTLCQLALNSPWGRMVRAIRDNETASAAMGKNIKARHLQIFVIGSAVVGIAGAMMTTLDGQFTPGTYNPLRYTFLIWVMVIVGGSGNNLGSILGGFLVWFVWIEAEPLGTWLMSMVTSGMDPASDLRAHLIGSAQYMRLMVMGAVLLLVMRFTPGGILPEKSGHN